LEPPEPALQVKTRLSIIAIMLYGCVSVTIYQDNFINSTCAFKNHL